MSIHYICPRIAAAKLARPSALGFRAPGSPRDLITIKSAPERTHITPAAVIHLLAPGDNASNQTSSASGSRRAGKPTRVPGNSPASGATRLSNGRNRRNCLRPVIRFLSNGATLTAQHRRKILCFWALSKAARSRTKGNIQPFKPFAFQEKIEKQALFATSRTAATEETGQTKSIRYPVLIRNRRPCYQNN